MKRLLLSFTLLAIVASVKAQLAVPPLSPHGRVEQQIGFTTITIDYHRPSARGREIFGGLVPYGKRWKTGGGDCTKIKFSEPVVVEGRPLVPGTYSLYSVPGESQWTIILNRDTTGYYQEENDVLRFQVNPYTTSRFFNALTIDLDFIPEEAEVHINWAHTGVAFRIETDTDKRLTQLSDDQLGSQSQNPEFFALAAEYYLFRNDRLDRALLLADRALSLEPRCWHHSLKVGILNKSGRYAESLEVLKRSIAYDKGNPENWSKEQLDGVLNSHAAAMKELQAKLQR
ncbi:MAG TPA: DUF2911 domain-containing protein [Chryseosolibacter sp.]